MLSFHKELKLNKPKHLKSTKRTQLSAVLWLILFIVLRQCRQCGTKIRLHVLCYLILIYTDQWKGTVRSQDLWYGNWVNSSTNYKFLDWTKLKAWADDELDIAQMVISVFNRMEHIVRKGQNAGDQDFLLTKGINIRVVKSRDFEV